MHASRHTCATVMLANGVPLEVVSAILRHASIRMTADAYARVVDPTGSWGAGGAGWGQDPAGLAIAPK